MLDLHVQNLQKQLCKQHFKTRVLTTIRTSKSKLQKDFHRIRNQTYYDGQRRLRNLSIETNDNKRVNQYWEDRDGSTPQTTSLTEIPSETLNCCFAIFPVDRGEYVLYSLKSCHLFRDSAYRISSNKSRGQLYLFSHQKGAIIRGRRLFQILLTGSRALNILFYYIDTSVLLENISLVKFIKTTSGTRVVYFP